jgi:hypothetical protein
MQTLTLQQANRVSGGEMTCTVGTNGASCTGTLSEWAGAAEGFAGLLHDTGEWWGIHIYNWTHPAE